MSQSSDANPAPTQSAGRGILRLLVILLAPWLLGWGAFLYIHDQRRVAALTEAQQHQAYVDQVAATPNRRPFHEEEMNRGIDRHIAAQLRANAAAERITLALWALVLGSLAILWFVLGGWWAWRGFTARR